MKRLLFLALLLPWSALAAPIVADLSTYRIAIDASFSGMRMFLFGARGETGDVVVVIRGPDRQFTVRKKERVAGMWVNRRHMTFHDVPDFYAVAATHPLDAPEMEDVRRALGIGSDMLLAPPAGDRNTARAAEFGEALLAYQHARRLYPDLLPLSFMGETLFKTVIPFPDTIPRGVYTAEIYLISSGQLVGMQTLPIVVQNTGFDAAVFDFAHGHPLFYGLCAVLLALAAGWAADRVFNHP